MYSFGSCLSEPTWITRGGKREGRYRQSEWAFVQCSIQALAMLMHSTDEESAEMFRQTPEPTTGHGEGGSADYGVLEGRSSSLGRCWVGKARGEEHTGQPVKLQGQQVLPVHSRLDDHEFERCSAAINIAQHDIPHAGVGISGQELSEHGNDTSHDFASLASSGDGCLQATPWEISVETALSIIVLIRLQSTASATSTRFQNSREILATCTADVWGDRGNKRIFEAKLRQRYLSLFFVSSRLWSRQPAVFLHYALTADG